MSKDYEVCTCFHVSVQTIEDAISQGATSLGLLQEQLHVGTQCRCCMFEEADTSKVKKKIHCKSILNQYKEQ